MATITLLSAYLISIVALVFFILAMARGWFDSDAKGAHVIFGANEVGTPEDPAAGRDTRAALDARELAARLQHWDAQNLFVVGASVYAHNAGYNPTGPLAALALRLGDDLVSYAERPRKL